ncbi:hypothetical protein PINS_up006330 [Pythium insidiosum]|nr:hypothetical protein PINS_up006330 [Pythium insidiosum]
MVRSAGVKKKPGDFKRPKRKVGRKAPQAANVTSVAISSRRINMLEQSVLQDKRDAATTHRHLTLQDLLGQLGHYNAHVRQRALHGLRELATLHADNVLANVAIVLERFLRTFVDDEAIVREAAVQAWKVLLPVLQAGKSLTPFAKLIAMYFCSGLTHLQVGIRQDTLRAIGALLDAAPELLARDAGVEQLGRLIENFRDLIAAAQTQGIKVTNTYDLLNTTTSSSSAAGGAGKRQQEQQADDKRKKKAPGSATSAALALRFAGLTVLHKLLATCDVDSTVSSSSASSALTARASGRSAHVSSTRVLLLYATPTLVVSGASERQHSAGFWQLKSRVLLQPLLELWLECVESETVDTLSDEVVEHLQRVVECVTTILSANADALAAISMDRSSGSDAWSRVVRRLLEQLLVRFPMFPTNDLAMSGDAYLSRWYGINVALARFACVLLNANPQLQPRASSDDSEDHVALAPRVVAFLQQTLAKYTASDELRVLPGSHAVIRSLLEVLQLVLASLDREDSTPTARETREALLQTFSALYARCSPRSVLFRSCTAFVIDRLTDLRRWPSWPLVLEWLQCFGQFLGQLEAAHVALGRRCLLTMISVMKQLPRELAQGDALDAVLASLERFFNVGAETTAPCFRLDDLAAADQLEFASLVFHLPRYPVALLRALASCCKSARVDLDAKSFLIDMLHQRRDELDLAHLVSFLLSGVLSPSRPDGSDVNANRGPHLALVHHVCRVLVAMNLGASLAKILAPLLSRQAATVDALAPVDMHTLVLLYRACLASVKTIHRSELPAEMIDDLVRIAGAALRAFASQVDSQGAIRVDEPALLADLLLTVQLSDDVIDHVLQTLVASSDGGVAPLRALQFVLRAESMRPWVVAQHERISTTIAGVQSDDDAVQRVLRQLQGDLELVVVGSAKQ